MAFAWAVDPLAFSVCFPPQLTLAADEPAEPDDDDVMFNQLSGATRLFPIIGDPVYGTAGNPAGFYSPPANLEPAPLHQNLLGSGR